MHKDNGQYLEELIDRYQDLIFTVCYRYTGDYFGAEDLAQETFLSAYRALPKFDGQNEKAWLIRIARNKCLDALKNAQSRVLPTEDELLDLAACSDRSPEDRYLDQEISERLASCCRSLPPPYREIAVGYFADGQSAAELAAYYGRKLKTVQTQILRSRELLQAAWKKDS